MEKLNNLLLQLENHIPNLEKTNPNVTKSTVGWQIEHCLLIINGVVKQLQKSNPKEYNYKFNFPKLIVFTFGKIPRGKAKAPNAVSPTEEATKEALFEKLELAKSSLVKLSDLPKNTFFNHPFFGDLNKKEVEKFFFIHTKHHLKIIEDILK